MMHHKDITLLKNDKWTPGGHLIDIWWTTIFFFRSEIKKWKMPEHLPFLKTFFVIIIVIPIIPKDKLQTVTIGNKTQSGTQCLCPVKHTNVFYQLFPSSSNNPLDLTTRIGENVILLYPFYYFVHQKI